MRWLVIGLRVAFFGLVGVGLLLPGASWSWPALGVVAAGLIGLRVARHRELDRAGAAKPAFT